MDDRDKIRYEVSIVDTISEYTKLKKSGSSWTGLCPFHNDKNPSFSVSEEKGLYNCFSCGASGDIFKFIQEKQNLEFSEALIYLAEKHNIELTYKKSNSTEKSDYRILEDLNAWVVKIFKDTDYGKRFRNYMEKRGFETEWCVDQGIGAWLPQGGLFKEYIKKKKIDKKIFIDLGVIKKSDPEKKYQNDWEYFAERVSFPIRDSLGRIRGWSARTLDNKNPRKYVNSPNSSIFKKSELLYNWHNARKDKGPLILCEGQADVLRFEKEGIGGAVAPLGTAFSENQAYMVKRVKNEAIIVMDGDEKGVMAANKAIGTFLKAGIEPLVVIPPEGKDPDEWLREKGKEGWTAAKKENALDFKLQQIVKEENGLKTEISKQRAIEKIKPIIENIDKDFLQDQIIEKISQSFVLPKHLVITELKKEIPKKKEGYRQEKKKFVSEEEELFKYLFKNPNKWDLISEILNEYNIHEFQNEKIRNIFFVMNSIKSVNPKILAEQLEEKEISFMTGSLISEEKTTIEDVEEILKILILRNLKKERRLVSISEKKDKIKKINEINKKINNISQEGVPGWNEL